MSERLRDDPSEWGLSPLEYQQRELTRVRARDRQRRQANALARTKAPPPARPAIPLASKPRRRARPLTSSDGIELALSAVEGPHKVCGHKQDPVAISLPFVSFLYEKRP